MKLKKFLSIVFTVLLLLSLSIGIFASSPDMEECPRGGQHDANYSEHNGYYMIYCSKCTHIFDEGYV